MKAATNMIFHSLALAAAAAAHGADASAVTVDKAAREVRFMASPTGVGAGDIAEFFIITGNSGHDYEALFKTEAKAADICAAIISLGLEPGEGIDYEAFRFWPKGGRVHAAARFPGKGAAALDSFVTDARTGAPLPREGFVFVGAPDADGAGPGSVISTYNEASTVLDVPRRCVQEEVYEKFRVSDGFQTNKALAVEIILKPEERPAGAPRRVLETNLAFTTNGVAAGAGAASKPPAEALAALRALADAGRDIHAAPLWDGALTLAQVRAYARFLKMIDVDGMVRVGPPAAVDPYYKAFDPPDEWRVREKRFAQPCELRFGADGAAALVSITEVWRDGELKPDLQVSETPGVTAEMLPQALEGRGNDLKVLLVFAPGSLRYSAVRPFISAVRSTHPNIHVFVD